MIKITNYQHPQFTKHIPMPSAKEKFISSKIKKIEHEGVRRNTHAAVSKSNPRRKVPIKRAIAIAESESRK